MLFCHVVFGPSTVTPSLAKTSGYAGVASDASSASVQLRLPLPPWPACTNQSRPHGVSRTLLRVFGIEIEPSEHVVWLWKSPATYVPSFSPAFTVAGAAATAAMPRAVATPKASLVLLIPGFMESP